MEEEGRITGVMDDRGKFIYISREEMAAVADYVNSRGRVAIGELAAKSSTFIDLEHKCDPGSSRLHLHCTALNDTALCHNVVHTCFLLLNDGWPEGKASIVLI